MTSVSVSYEVPSTVLYAKYCTVLEALLESRALSLRTAADRVTESIKMYRFLEVKRASL